MDDERCQGSLKQVRSGTHLKRVAVAGTKIYLTLTVIQFLLGMLFCGTLILLGYDLAAIEALLRDLL